MQTEFNNASAGLPSSGLKAVRGYSPCCCTRGWVLWREPGQLEAWQLF